MHAAETLTPKCLAGVWPRRSLRIRTEQITAVRCVAFQRVFFFLKGAAKLGGGSGYGKVGYAALDAGKIVQGTRCLLLNLAAEREARSRVASLITRVLQCDSYACQSWITLVCV